jgi:hypothetical protein
MKVKTTVNGLANIMLYLDRIARALENIGRQLQTQNEQRPKPTFKEGVRH